jgi:hypothetical protein
MNSHGHHSIRRSRGIRRGLRACAWLLLMIAGIQVQAAVRIDNLRTMDLGTWSPGLGNAVATQDFCVQSDFLGFLPLDWAARVDDLGGASTATEYRIEPNGGGNPLTLTIRLIDLRTGAGETLVPGVLSAMDKTGDTRDCPRGLNGRLEVRVDAADLASAPAGRFDGRFELFATGVGFGSDTSRFRVRIEVPDLVRVSDLDDIDLGIFPGTGDLVGEDRICVYRNDPSTRYEVEAYGQGAASAFVLEQGTGSLPFEVEYDDGGGYAPVSAGRSMRASGADTASTACGGMDNAGVRVRVRESDLLTADAGSYAGTLTLTVAPI